MDNAGAGRGSDLELAELLERAGHRERNVALGALVGGFAHEYNNICGRILGFAELLEDEDVSAQGRHFLDEIRRAALQATELSRWIGRFSRRRNVGKQRTSLSSVAEDALAIVRPEMKSELVRVEIDGDGHWNTVVVGDLVLLVQAVVQMLLVRYSVGLNVSAMTLSADAAEGGMVALRVSADGSLAPGESLEARLSAAGSPPDGDGDPGVSRQAETVLRSHRGGGGEAAAQPGGSGKGLVDVLSTFGLQVTRAVADFHGGDLSASGGDLVLSLPVADD